jgi:hypothetical protein
MCEVLDSIPSTEKKCYLDTLKKLKSQPTEQKKIFANHLVYRIYKELLQLNSKKTNNPNKKGKELE